MTKNHPLQFGNQARDGIGKIINAASGFTTRDATGTPIASPLAYLTTTITLVVPDNAVRLMLTPSTALRVSEDPAMARYYVVAANAVDTFDVSLTPNVYIARDSVSGTVNFRFTTV